MKNFFANLSDNSIVTIKTVTYRILGSSSSFLLAYLYTGKLKEAGAYALISALIHIVLFWLHEKAWRITERKYRN